MLVPWDVGGERPYLDDTDIEREPLTPLAPDTVLGAGAEAWEEEARQAQGLFNSPRSGSHRVMRHLMPITQSQILIQGIQMV